METLATLPPDAISVFWFFFGLALIASLLFVLALLYHWIRFGLMYPFVWVAMPVYLVGVVVLIGGMLAGISTL